jgi:hypothetical protein
MTQGVTLMTTSLTRGKSAAYSSIQSRNRPQPPGSERTAQWVVGGVLSGADRGGSDGRDSDGGDDGSPPARAPRALACYLDDVR